MKSTELFMPIDDGKPHTRKLVKDALERVRSMDETDDKNGNASPKDCSLSLHLRVAITALIAGITLQDWAVVADGLVFVSQAELRVRGKP